MKKLLPVLVTAAAAVVAVAAVRMLESDPLPAQPDGVWELDEDETTS
jgi:nitrous oxidase accessory protein NosD